MAKNENKDEFKQIKPEITETTATKPQTTTPSKGGFARSLLTFIFLILAGATAFLAVQLQQNEQLTQNAIKNLQKHFEQKNSALVARINALESSVDELKNRPQPDIKQFVSEEMLTRRLLEMRQEILSVQNVGEYAIMPLPLVEPETAPVKLAEDINQKQSQEIMLASGALIVRDLAEDGNSFIYEIEVLRILAQGNPVAMNYVNEMRKYAISGIHGKNYLIKSFNKIFAELNNAHAKPQAQTEQTPADSAWYNKTLIWAKKLFISKKGSKRPHFKSFDDEVYNLVNEGNLGEALNALQTSEKYSRVDSQALNQWQHQVRAYLDFNHAAASLIMNSLANLHLKELEH